MARTAITKTTAPGAYGGAWEELTLAAADVENGNNFVLTGREILVMYNSSADTAYYVTLTSVDDRFGRSEDITQVDIPFGDYMIFGPIPLEGWQQTDGTFYVDAENAAILLGVIVLP